MPETLKRQAFMTLVQSAIKKANAKQPLEEKERRAWERWEAEEDERRGLRFLGRVPKRLYCLWSGRPTKILHDQADLYGLPLRGATIDVPAVIAWTHEFLARWKHDLAPLVKGAGAGRDPGLKEQLLVEQVQLYRRRVLLLEHDLARKAGESLDRAETHTLLAQIALVLRGAGEQLHKQFGATAVSILEFALDNCESLIDQLVAAAKEGEAPAALENAAAPPDDRRTPLAAPRGAGPADSPAQPIRGRGRRHPRRKKSGD